MPTFLSWQYYYTNFLKCINDCCFTDFSEPEYLGSMSFGVKHIYLQNKTVDGWFFLLNEKLGKTKHLQVTCHHDNNKMEEDESLHEQYLQSLTVSVGW